jgi:hypothetical protein
MTRARELSRFTNENVFSVEAGTFNVGIGSTTPDVKLDVGGSIEATGISTFQNNLFVGAGITMLASSGIVSAVSFYGDFYGNGENLTGVASTDNIITDTLAQFNGGVGIADSIFHIGDDNTAIRFRTNDVVTVETGGEERTRVTTTGLGIGTDNPSNTLSVVGSDTPPVYIAGANPGIKFEDTNASGTPISYIYASDGQLSLRADDGNESASSLIEFKVDGSERLRINSSGNVGIGTDLPNYKLHLHSATAGDSNYLQITHSDAGGESSDGLQLGLARKKMPI